MTTLTAQFDVPITREAPRTTRKAVAAILSGWGYTEEVWAAETAIVVSELVTNAVQHGAGSVVFSIEAHDSQVVVCIADGSSVVPRRREPDGRGGRGLMLVDSLTRHWHVEAHEGGKRVRAELKLYPDIDDMATETGTGREHQ